MIEYTSTMTYNSVLQTARVFNIGAKN